MALKNALLWSGLQTTVRLVLSFASIKVTAVYLGPAGLALVGQLSNFLGLLQGGLGNAIQTGVIKLTAEAQGDRTRLVPLWGTAFRLAAGIGMVAGLAIIAAAVPISGWLLDDRAYWPVIVVAGVIVPLTLINLVLTGALNGLQQISILGIFAIGSAVLGALLFIPLSYAFGIWGGLIGSALSYGAVVAVTLLLMGRCRLISRQDFLVSWQGRVALSLIAFYPMLLVHSIAEPAALLLVRNALASEQGMGAAGLWQATWRLSEMYTMVLMTALSLFVLPHLSAIRDARVFNRELRLVVLKVTAMTAAAAAALYISRDLIIAVVFTREFDPMRELLAYQLLGDVFRMAGWPLRAALVIKLRQSWYICVEAGVAAVQVGLTYLWLPEMATRSATAAYAAAWGGVLFLLLTFAYKGLWSRSSGNASRT